MASLFEYFDKHYPDCVKFSFRIPMDGEKIEGKIYHDTRLMMSFLSVYVNGKDRNMIFFKKLLALIKKGQFKLDGDNFFILPDARTVHGNFIFENNTIINMKFRYFGDDKWFSTTKDFINPGNVFIYSETDLSGKDIIELKEHAASLTMKLQFRSEKFRKELSMEERPFAFISHDSRDKSIARDIANELQRKLCPVWYDEYKLKVGANLRDSIEKGLKECKKCILILSPNFFSNTGWTKKEFDSIFTREILEETSLILPVWFKVKKLDVYNYSPSLLNIVALNYDDLGLNKVCNELYSQIL